VRLPGFLIYLFPQMAYDYLNTQKIPGRRKLFSSSGGKSVARSSAQKQRLGAVGSAVKVALTV